MKNKKALILIVVLIVSILLNIVLAVALISRKIENNNNKNGNSILGIYQTQYFNSNNVSMTITLILNEGGKGRGSSSVTEFSGSTFSDFTWEKNGNSIIITDKNGNTVTAELLPSGNIFFNGFQLRKIN